MVTLEDRPRCQPITGWRYWQLDGVGAAVRLRSLSQRASVWRPGRIQVARCAEASRQARATAADVDPHPVPGTECACGIHASVDLASLQAQALCLRPVPLVVGEVALWGRVVTEERADRRGVDHRGQFAYPVRLAVVGETMAGQSGAEAAEALSTYQVTVEVTSLEEAVGELSQSIMGFLAMSGATRP